MSEKINREASFPINSTEGQSSEFYNKKETRDPETTGFDHEEEAKVDIKKIEEDDQKKLTQVRESLNLENKQSRRWTAVRKPPEEWEHKTKITTENPLEKLKDFFNSLSKKEREAKRLNQELQNDFIEDRKKYKEMPFVYNKGAGVEGRVAKEEAILAQGFGECSGLILQTSDKVAVIHISPNVFRDPSDGGEIVRDNEPWGHVSSALKKILEESEGLSFQRTTNHEKLSSEEISRLQEMIDSGQLKSTMLSGEPLIVAHQTAVNLTQFSKFNNLPVIKPEIHYVGSMGGGGGYAIYASPEDVYYIGSNNKVMKQGKNFPTTMYKYE